jgi:hypothetical protein
MVANQKLYSLKDVGEFHGSINFMKIIEGRADTFLSAKIGNVKS